LPTSTDTSTADTTPIGDRSPSRGSWVDVGALALLALVVRIPAYLAERGLSFDDGVFANSAIAMRDGGMPFRDVFSSQGPMFLPLVWVGDLVGTRTLDSPRVLAVVSGILAVLATYWAALRLTDRVGAVLAGALLATSGGLAWVTGPLAADGPALAFAAIAMGLALRQRDHATWWRAVLLGAAVGAVLSTKSLEAPVLVPVAIVLLAPVVSSARRRQLHVEALVQGVLAAVSAVVVFLAVSLPWGMADVWDQSVLYRTDAAADRDIPATALKAVTTLWDRDLALIFFAALALGFGIAGYRRTGHARSAEVASDASWWSVRRRDDLGDWVPSGRLLSVSWLVCTLAWLVLVVSPLWRPHLAAVSIPLVLVIGVYRPPMRVVLVGAVLAVPMVVIQLDGLLSPGPYRGTEAELVAALAALPDGAWVISDEPGVVWRAGRRTTDDLVDPSMLRREQDRYTEDSLVADADDPRICAFVRISEQRFAHFDELPGRLEALGYVADPEVGDGSVLYVRSDCAPTS
jgi:4-amino-4-deoxy-L-arabinose transferase-like glycosyltransferase